MSYRFTNTGKWCDEWFIDLSSSEKLMFMYLCDNCDSGGFFELSMRKISFDTGMSAEDVKVNLKGLQRGYILSLDKRILFLRNYLKHQKNLPLNPQNMAHKGIFKRFENYKNRFDVDLLDLISNETKPQEESEFKGASKGHIEGLESPIGIGNGIGNDLEDIQVKNKGIDFENFWSLYGKKVGDKAKVTKKWNALSIGIQKKILEVLPEWKAQYTDKQFQPFPETFLNQKRWNDEIIKSDERTITTGSKATTTSSNREELESLVERSAEFLQAIGGQNL